MLFMSLIGHCYYCCWREWEQSEAANTVQHKCFVSLVYLLDDVFVVVPLLDLADHRTMMHVKGQLETLLGSNDTVIAVIWKLLMQREVRTWLDMSMELVCRQSTR